MINDYSSWIKENQDFLDSLSNKNSIIYDSLNDVIKVMDFLNSGRVAPAEIDKDIFLSTGYSYLHTTVSELKLYLEKYLNNDIKLLIQYEPLIFFSLYLDEIRLLIIDNNKYTETVKKEFEDILNSIESILKTRGAFSDEVISEFNFKIEAVLPKDINYYTIPEIFFRAAEELNII